MKPLTPTEDIRAARHKLAAKFDNDLDLIVADLRCQEARSDAEFVTLAGRSPTRLGKQAVCPTSGSDGLNRGDSTPAAQ